MYTSQFFNQDKAQSHTLSHIVSAYKVSTDAAYNYTVSQDDIMFYPHNTYCLIVVTMGGMNFTAIDGSSYKILAGQAMILYLRDISSYKSISERLEYLYFNFVTAAQELPHASLFDATIDTILLDYLMNSGTIAAPCTVVDGLFAAFCHSLTHKTVQKSALAVEPSEYIKQKLYFKLTNQDIANHFNISTRALTNIFNKRHGTTPQGYLFKLKIERAMTLLSTTTTPISEIAYLLSFNSPFHFSNRFKQFCGVSPSEYRRNFIN